jgi:hypothetical protein
MMPAENNFPGCLRPYHLPEIITPQQAAAIAGRSIRTILNWCNEFGIGRRIGGGKWAISHPALLMLLDGNQDALRTYLSGDRSSEDVAEYYARATVPLPQNSQRSQCLRNAQNAQG